MKGTGTMQPVQCLGSTLFFRITCSSGVPNVWIKFKKREGKINLLAGRGGLAQPGNQEIE
jgi:hypothetical protein